MIKTDRKEFIGVHVNASVKEAIMEIAKKKGMSVSAYLSQWITVHLRRRGYKNIEKERL